MSYGHSLGWEHSIWVFVAVVTTKGDLHYRHNYLGSVDSTTLTISPQTSSWPPLDLSEEAQVPHWVPPFPRELHRAEHGSLTPNKLSQGVIPPYPLLHPSTRHRKRCQSCHCPLLKVILVVVFLCCYSVLHLAAPNLIL